MQVMHGQLHGGSYTKKSFLCASGTLLHVLRPKLASAAAAVSSPSCHKQIMPGSFCACKPCMAWLQHPELRWQGSGCSGSLISAWTSARSLRAHNTASAPFIRLQAESYCGHRGLTALPTDRFKQIYNPLSAHRAAVVMVA